MANYFVINRPSNLITGVVASRYNPTETSLRRFIPATDKARDAYYKLVGRKGDVCVDVGELLSKSEYTLNWLKDSTSFSDEGKAIPQVVRYRAEEPTPETQDRQAAIFDWLDHHPEADAYDLNDEFCMGMLAAKAYVAKHS
ncbi:hypothetical protein [Azotobacter chroococcum]|uniref:hypothetical protein n=1 Tax=Azotobacter chroococcum TaxID=353 RepID=UPI001185E82F|nr:hypothetical protein [Azotobacter chroococcum]